MHCQLLDTSAILPRITAPNTPAICEATGLYGAEIPVSSQVDLNLRFATCVNMSPCTRTSENSMITGLDGRACQSDIEEMGPNTFFRRIIVERGPGDNMATRKYPLVGREEMRKVVFCSGQIFYELYHARTTRKIHDVTLVRIEQIAPFPFDRIASVLRLYPKAEWCWAQQEPKNMGAWSYVQPRFRTAVKQLCKDVQDRDLHYVGRPVSASPATGLFRSHLDENKQLVDQAFT